MMILWLGWVGVMTAHADEAAKILQGYGKSRWGQSLAEVAKLYPEGDNGGSGSDKSTADVAAGLPSGSATYSAWFVKAPEPLQRIEFSFQDDRLSAVTLVLSKLTTTVRHSDRVAEDLWKKYFADPALRSQLAEQRIYIRVQAPESEVQILVSGEKMDRYKHPVKPEDLVYPLHGSDLTVTYKNENLSESINAEHEEKRRQAMEEAATKLDLSHVL